MGTPLPEDGSALAHWKARRAIRNLVWLVGGLTIVYLLGLALQQARANRRLVETLQGQQSAFEDRMVRSLAGILLQVQTGQAAAEEAGRPATITVDAAVKALKESFPPELVDRAVRIIQAPATTTTTTTTAATRPSRAPPTTTTTAGPPATTTTVTAPPPPMTTTTTMRPCTLGLNVPGLARLCIG